MLVNKKKRKEKKKTPGLSSSIKEIEKKKRIKERFQMLWLKGKSKLKNTKGGSTKIKRERKEEKGYYRRKQCILFPKTTDMSRPCLAYKIKPSIESTHLLEESLWVDLSHYQRCRPESHCPRPYQPLFPWVQVHPFPCQNSVHRS